MTDRIYEYLRETIPRQGYAPSVREIGAAVGLRSPSTVHFHLKRLQEQGLIEKGDFKGRAIVLTDRPDAPVQPQKDRVPIVGSVAAGSPILAQECIEDYLTFDCQGREQEYFALHVRGESMLNAGILPGDLVVVRRQSTANNGEIVVALLGDEATVKRFSRKNGEIWLMPENDAYDPIDGREAQILGKVTAVVRQYC
jgi:repressor LexA